MSKRICLFSTIALVVLVCTCLYPSLANAAEPGEVYERTYLHAASSRACVRRLTKSGRYGCFTPTKRGSHGTLRLANTTASMQRLVTAGMRGMIAPVIPAIFLNRGNLSLMMTAYPTSIAGIVVLDDPSPSEPTSAASRTPLREYDPLDGAYEWNPHGLDLLSLNVSFAIVSFNSTQSALIEQRAVWNELRIANDDEPTERIHFRYYMYAQGTSRDCLSRLTCLPVGGYSVWGTFGAPNGTHTKTVMAVTGVDASSLYPNKSPGAASAVASTAALLAAVQALSKAPNVTTLDKQIAFALFEGEQWSSTGSRAWLTDVAQFKCNEPNPSNTTCRSPFRASMAFRNMTIANLETTVEMHQIALNGTTLFAHVDPSHVPSSTVRDQLVNVSKAVPPPYPPGKPVLETGTGPGLPPSAGWSFRRLSPNTSVVVISDHAAQYVNRHYQSAHDTIDFNVGPDMGYNQICAAATLWARSLYSLASNQTSGEALEGIRANCEEVVRLMSCLSQNTGCSLIRQYNSAAEVPRLTSPTAETGVYLPMEDEYIRGTTRFFRSYLRSATYNASAVALGLDPASPKARAEARSSAYFHDALDPDVQYDRASNRFVIAKLDNETSSQLWTESNWYSDVGVRLYRVETVTNEIVYGVIAAVVTVASVVLTILGRRECERRFKAV